MKKIVYIIPGYCESHLRQCGYNKISKFFDDQGMETVYVGIELIWGASLSTDPCINHINIQEVSGGELVDIKWFDKEDLPNENIKPEFLKSTF